MKNSKSKENNLIVIVSDDIKATLEFLKKHHNELLSEIEINELIYVNPKNSLHKNVSEVNSIKNRESKKNVNEKGYFFPRR